MTNDGSGFMTALPCDISRPLSAGLGALVLVALAWRPAVAADAGRGTPSEPSATDASLSQTFEPPEKPRVGDPLELQLRIDHPPKTSVHVEPDLEGSRWELSEKKRSTLQSAESEHATRMTLIFQVFRPGETTLDPFDVVVSDRTGDKHRLRTEPVRVRIESVLADVEQPSFQGPRPPRPVWRRDTTLAWVGGGLVLAMVFGLALLAMFRTEEPEPEETERPPEDVAREKLERLRSSDLLEHGDFMVFYVRMSEAVRRYLGRRFGFPGTELTTHEIVERLESPTWHGDIELDDIADWMRAVDLVKFTGIMPSAAEARELLDRAFDIVEETHVRQPESRNDEEAAESEAGDDDEPETAAVEESDPALEENSKPGPHEERTEPSDTDDPEDD